MRIQYEALLKDGRWHYCVIGEREFDEDDDGSVDQVSILLPEGFQLLQEKYNLEVAKESEYVVLYEARDQGMLSRLNELKDILESKAISSIDPDKPLDMDEAAKYLNISKRALYKLTSKNALPYFKAQGKNYFDVVDLRNYLRKERVESRDEIKRLARDRSV